MNTRVLVASVLMLSALVGTANALSIANEDNAAYVLKLTPKTGKPIDVSVKAKATLDVDCKGGCTVALNGKSQNIDAKTAKLLIKGASIILN